MSFFSFKIKYAGYELLWMRVLFAALAYKTFNSFLTFSQQEFPIGIAHFFDLTFLANGTVFLVLNILFKVALCAYILGRGLILSTGYMLLYSTILATLFYSQGTIGHGYNIVSLVMLAQFVAYVHGYVLFGAKPKEDGKPNSHDLAIYFTHQMIAAAYVIAGMTKLIRAGFVHGIIPAWIVQLKYVAVQIIKSHDQSFYGYLDPAIYEKGNVIAHFLIEHERLTQVFFGMGLFLELCAFMLLISRGFSIVMGISIIVMHISIMLVMNLHFWTNIYILAIFTLHLPWMVVQVGNKARAHIQAKKEVQNLKG